MKTFTFITDYQGGTYISQQTANGLLDACHHWKDHILSGRYIQDLDVHQFAEAFDADINELPPVGIDEVINVWVFQLIITDHMLSVHIVLTDLSTKGVSEESNGNRVSSRLFV